MLTKRQKLCAKSWMTWGLEERIRQAGEAKAGGSMLPPAFRVCLRHKTCRITKCYPAPSEKAEPSSGLATLRPPIREFGGGRSAARRRRPKLLGSGSLHQV